MVAKAKTTTAKTSTKTAKATTVKKEAKTKKPPVKTAKKITKKVTKPKAPKITDEMFADYFFKLSYKRFIQLTEEWNDENLKVRLQKHDTYDGWLNYFKTLPVNKLKLLSSTGLDILPAEAYAALSFWRDVMTNPSRINKIHKAGLTAGDKSAKTIVDYAKENDRLGVLEAMRDNLASKLQQGAGARDAGTLSAQLTEIMTQIEVYKKRLGPKKETALGALMSDMPEIKGKRPSENGKGARHTSFASRVQRVTIEDLEDEDE